EHAGHPSDHGRRETSDLLILIHHRIEGMADDDGESIGAVFLRVLCNVSDDGDIDANKIISTLTWLARNACRDNEHVSSFEVGPIGCTDHARVGATLGARLFQVESLTFGKLLLAGNIEQHNVTELL